MLWRKELNIQCLGVLKYFIDVEIRGDEVWRFTGIYGEPKWDQKHLTWEALRSLYGGGVSMPWLAIGDFNEILYHHEKEGGRTRAQVHLQAFRDALMDCELDDIGFLGDGFTWQRGRIREILDRGIANAGWNTLFPNAQLVNGEMVKSDHRPLIVNTEGCSSYALPRSGPRRFEARWLKEETVEEIVQAAWACAVAMGHGPKLMSKVKVLHADMHEWDKNVLKKPA